MNTIQQPWTLPTALRYCIAIPVAGFVSVLVLVGCGLPEKGPDLLRAERALAFGAVFAAGFCFPSFSRWIHSAALLGLGVALYCFVRPMDDMSYRWEFLPQFRVLIGGGSLAVALHAFIDLMHWTTRGRARALPSNRLRLDNPDGSGKAI